jgi:hypothetical protein
MARAETVRVLRLRDHRASDRHTGCDRGKSALQRQAGDTCRTAAGTKFGHPFAGRATLRSPAHGPRQQRRRRERANPSARAAEQPAHRTVGELECIFRHHLGFVSIAPVHDDAFAAAIWRHRPQRAA